MHHDIDAETEEYLSQWLVVQEPTFFCFIGDALSIHVDAEVLGLSHLAAARRRYDERFGYGWDDEDAARAEAEADRASELAYARHRESIAERGSWFGYGD